MSVEHETILFDVNDFKVYALEDDSGASPSYGAAVDVYGIANVSLDPNFVTAVLKGDAKIIARKGKLDQFNAKTTYGRLSADVLEVVLGAEVADVSSSHARTRFRAATSLPYFKAAFLISDADNGVEDVQVHLYKCQISGGTLLGQQTDQFGQPTLEFSGIGLDCAGGPWQDIMADFDFFNVATPLEA